MSWLRSAVRVVDNHRRAYAAINLGYYGLVVVAMLYVSLFNRPLQQQLLDSVQGAFTEGPLSTVGGAYLEGNVVLAAVLTFVVNLVAGSFLYITLPSLILPFAGLAVGALRAVLWGLVLAPTSTQLALVMIPHSLTLILEGQAYVLAIFAAYVQGLAFVRPSTVGERNRVRGYLAGLRLTALLYVLVTLVLAASALYEAIEVVAMVRLGGALSG
jgi:hypothetical protein